MYGNRIVLEAVDSVSEMGPNPSTSVNGVRYFLLLLEKKIRFR